MKEKIKKIEKELMPEIEEAAKKNNMKRIVVALTESVRLLTEMTDEINTTISKPKRPARKTTRKKAPAKKGTASKAKSTRSAGSSSSDNPE